MSFLKRLSFFLFGLSIGVVILIFISNKKDTRFNYMPNKRVLNDIYKKKWVFKDSNQIISKNDFLKNYDVNFSKSTGAGFNFYVDTILKITDTSNHKVKTGIYAATNNVTVAGHGGNATRQRTYIRFERLGTAS